MNENNLNDNRIVDAFIRYGLLFILIVGSIYILMPFIFTLVWGIIIAVALFRWYKKAVDKLNGKKNFTAFLFSAALLLGIIVPAILLTNSTVNGYQYLSATFKKGTLTIPPPTEDVASWPVIGEPFYTAWDLAAHNLNAFINKYAPQLEVVGKWMLDFFTGIGIDLIQFMVSVLVAGFLLSRWDAGQQTTHKFARRLVGERAEDFVNLTAGTIRTVVQGIIGVSVIQTVASAICLFAVGVPLAGIWSIVILVLTILQLPAVIVLGPIIIYVFSVESTGTAIVFTVFALLISVSDSLLKSMIMGKGTGIPAIIILLGAIGGMIVAGILGLFVGAVILALSYKLLLAWLNAEATRNSQGELPNS